ncbi:response regulator transcription factor [Ktedonobacter robiniae]|uniref:DNA-binding response regulator n=1 Tax=Ktedonobacter robiniae TaxID=2778365 RepID=A0ABQ3UGZ5_9CHLR|nr:response regulator transcription factor [Ktedonobacter robiniae]GHO51981.1 DNA-binding response regulator [Ktedonobacter robiniae]
MKKIMFVHPKPSPLSSLKRELKYRDFYVIEVSTCHEALAHLQTHPIDLVLLDAILPDQDGFTLCRCIRELGYSLLPLLIVSTRAATSDIVAGLKSGADDYITYPCAIEEPVARMQVALRRTEGILRRTVKLQVGDLLLDTRTRHVWRGGRHIELTHREYDLLEFLARNAGCVLPKERIFEHVWGYDNDAGLEVIKVYIKYLRMKLNAGEAPDLIHAVRGIGYTLQTVCPPPKALSQDREPTPQGLEMYVLQVS